MNKDKARKNSPNPAGIFAIAAILITLMTAWPCRAQKPGLFQPDEGRIHITSDKMVIKSNENSAEFIGKAHAVQGKTEIKSDRLKIFYKAEEGAQPGQSGMSESSIQRMEAEGSVVIYTDEQTATSQKAVYTADDGLLTLTGERVEIKNNGNAIVGRKVTLQRETGEIVVSSDAGKRVEAVFESESGADNQDKTKTSKARKP
ncbi:lipopolysaccharide export system protein LptA [Desulfosalsimonas propionicica]|uniref:Lipopolysaccharide export system protein LptA n=1 Tax=Desulfosalsimonas propionicica TaxID=332175 RepID=A0A7W0C753_9BACT|nr:LptA/OstA family protein [Desulfosalsimonas propionicica]MBA2880409.1 lipopolysaccharide export system protein LptA [Desulfosalsimonas propionicica]